MKYILAWYYFEGDFPHIMVGNEPSIMWKLNTFMTGREQFMGIEDLVDYMNENTSLEYDGAIFSDEVTFSLATIDGKELFCW